MTFYAEMAQGADEILREFGAAGTVSYKTGSGEYDPDFGDYPEVEVTQACTAAVFPVDQKLVDGTTVLATDEQAYLSAVGLSILTLGGVARTVVSVKNLAPAGTSVLVELIVRR
jgi:hypothetical protein